MLGLGQREREEGQLCVAGFSELAGLLRILCPNQPRLHCVILLHALQGADGRQAKGRMQLIGDGNGLRPRIIQRIELERL